MSASVRHLRVAPAGIADDNGELVPPAQLVAELEQAHVDLAMAQRDVRAKNRRIAELERDHAAERLRHPDRELILRVCTYWHRRCRGANPRVTPDTPHRFDAVAALVELTRITGSPPHAERVYTPDAFKRAIDGAAYDCFQKQRRNGTWARYDDLELICRSAAKFDEFRARAPYPEPVLEPSPAPEKAARPAPGPEGSGSESAKRRPRRSSGQPVAAEPRAPQDTRLF